MSAKLSALLMASLLMSASVGCQGSNIVRGQSPADPTATIQQAGCQYCESGCQHCKQPIFHKQFVPPNATAPPVEYQDGYGGDCYGGQCQGGGYGGCPSCRGAGCGKCGGKCGYDGMYPRHCNTYSYQPPQDLSYPNPNHAPGAVQYPYYNCKGPSDFFYYPLNAERGLR